MLIGHNFVKLVSFFELGKNLISHIVTALACHKAEALKEDADIVNGHKLGETEARA